MAFESKNWLKLLLRWLSGAANRREEGQLDALAAEDPFLADAFEGYQHFPESDHVADISRIKGRLRQRVQKKERRVIPIWRIGIAASVLLIAIVSFWQLNKTVLQSPEMAMDNVAVEEPILKKEDLQGSDPQASNVEKLEEETEPEIQVTQENSVAAKENPPNLSEVPASSAFKPSPATISPPLALEDAITLEDPIVEEDDMVSEVLAKAPREDDLKGHAESAIQKELEEEMAETEVVFMDNVETKEEPKPVTGTVEGQMETVRPSLNLKAPGSQITLPPKPRQISGLVTDEFGEPLIGANVLFSNSKNGTMTGVDGRFTLLGTEVDQELEVAYVGFETQKIEVYDQEQLNISLNEAAASLSEVTVSAYENKSKRKQKALKKDKAVKMEENRKELAALPEGGFSKFDKYIKKNLNYPEEAAANKVSGEVILKFTVLPNGTISNIKVEKSLGFGCDEEAIRLLNEGPSWVSSKAQEVQYTIQFPSR